MNEVTELRKIVSEHERLREQVQGASVAAKVMIPAIIMVVGVTIWLYETFQHVTNSAKELIK